ncbi:MAG: glycosyltransferase family 4 protein [Lachnospiraceae bacterium]|nr:glycosyltransferase family 4 protein [Lachnospiraceae bacterium]
MNIMIITTEYPGECQRCGGLGTYTYTIGNLLAQNGHRIVILTLSEKHSGRETVSDKIVIEKVKYIGEAPRRTAWSELKYAALTAARAMVVAQKEKIDLIHCTSEQGIGLFIGKAIPKVTRISCDTILWRECNHFDYRFKTHVNRARVSDIIEYLAIRRSNTIIGPCTRINRIVGARIRKEIQTVETPFFVNTADCNPRKYNEKLAGKTYLITHGTLKNHKGTLLIGKCMKRILNAHPDLYYVFAGNDNEIETAPGQYRPAVTYLKNQAGSAKNRVIYLGSMKREELLPIISHAIACVLPSRVDNYPNTCVEAMAMGTVVVSTYGSGFEQICKNGENGFLIHPDNEAELIHTIDRIMKMDQNQYKEVCRSAVSTIDEISVSALVKKLENVYTITCSGKKRVGNAKHD